MATIGYILFACGALISIANFYFHILRYPIHVALGGTRETLRHESGVLFFGSVLLWISIGLLPSVGLKWLAAIISIFDTGGFHWIIIHLALAAQFPKRFRDRTEKE